MLLLRYWGAGVTLVFIDLDEFLQAPTAPQPAAAAAAAAAAAPATRSAAPAPPPRPAALAAALQRAPVVYLNRVNWACGGAGCDPAAADLFAPPALAASPAWGPTGSYAELGRPNPPSGLPKLALFPDEARTAYVHNAVPTAGAAGPVSLPLDDAHLAHMVNWITPRGETVARGAALGPLPVAAACAAAVT